MPQDGSTSSADATTLSSSASPPSLTHYLARVIRTLRPLVDSSRPEDRYDFARVGAYLDGIASCADTTLPTRYVGMLEASRQTTTIVALASCANLLEAIDVLVVVYQVSTDERTPQGGFYLEFTQILLGLLERHDVARMVRVTDAMGQPRLRFGEWVGYVSRSSAFGHALVVSGALPPLD